MMPLPQRSRDWQSVEQPSPLFWLPSSHTSPGSGVPSPHRSSERQLAEPPSPSSLLPSSHPSPSSTSPLPHTPGLMHSCCAACSPIISDSQCISSGHHPSRHGSPGDDG